MVDHRDLDVGCSESTGARLSLVTLHPAIGNQTALRLRVHLREHLEAEALLELLPQVRRERPEPPESQPMAPVCGALGLS